MNASDAQSTLAVDKDAEPDEYKVGPGRPPKATRWQKGAPSPNPQGRPRKPPALAPDIKKLFEDALHRKVSFTREGIENTISRLELGFEQLTIQFAKGDARARRDVLEYGARLGVDFSGAAQAVAEALAPGQQQILDSYISRTVADDETAVDAKRVIAPDDLLDDDVEKR